MNPTTQRPKETNTTQQPFGMSGRVNVLSLFNGCGMLRPALDKAGIEVTNYYSSEIDKYACQVANKNYPDTVQLGDVNDWQTWGLPQIDLLTAGFPCFVAGTKVITKNTYKKIEDVRIGDMVLTHKNRFRKVVNVGCTEAPTIEVKAQGMKPTRTTTEHPYYTRKAVRIWNTEQRRYERIFSLPKWIEAGKLGKGDYVGLPILKTSENPLGITHSEAWIIGRYIADGHTIKTMRKSEGRPNDRNWGLVLSIGSGKVDEFKAQCKTKFTFHKHTENVYRAIFSSKRLVEIVEQHCGCGAGNKHISMGLLNLPADLLASLLDGYWSGDGCKINDKYKATSISEDLILTLNLAVAKVHQVGSTYEHTPRPKKTVIQGREVNQSDTFSTVFRKEIKPRTRFYVDNGFIWLPIHTVKATGKIEKVFNMTVDEDNTYTANNIIVHNCQDLSVAGKQLGLNGERSGLLYEVLKIRDALKPKYFLFENVASMSKHWRDEITRLVGVNPVELNSKYWGAQNRARLFWTNIPGAKNIEMTQVQNDRKIYLKDILIDGAVDVEKGKCLTARYNGTQLGEKGLKRYYAKGIAQIVFTGVTQEEYDALFISSEKQLLILKADTPSNEMQRVAEFDGGSQGYRVYGRNGKGQTLAALSGGEGGKTGLVFACPAPQGFGCWACLTPDRVNKRQNGGRFKKDGKVFTLTAQDKHGVLRVKEATRKGYAEARVGDCINFAFPSSKTRRGRIGKGKSHTLMTSNELGVVVEIGIRKLHPIECERLMNLPDGYTEGVSNSQRYKMLGNGWDVLVVAELLKGLVEPVTEIQPDLFAEVV